MTRRTFLTLLALIASALAIAPATTQSSVPLNLVLTGDSTVCNYPTTIPTRGWGQFLEEHLQPGTVKVLNLAASGRSTKTFLSEGRWKKALDASPNYLFIQFGHNDSHDPKNPEATDFATDYKDNLRRYIDDARAIHAIPILVTPMVRRTFTPEGKISEASSTNRALASYAQSMREVAAEKHTPLIDLYASSKALAEKLGPNASNDLANKPGDNTHFNEKGARAMLFLILKDLPTAAPDLAPLLKPE